MSSFGVVGRVGLVVVAVSVSACTWVPLTSGGEGVRVVGAMEAAECQSVGKATASTSDRVGVFARTDRKIREELENLGRNEAADLGGNAIVPVGNPSEGRQAFDVYRCDTR